MVTNIFSANSFSGKSCELLQDEFPVDARTSLFFNGTRRNDAMGKRGLCFNVNRAS